MAQIFCYILHKDGVVDDTALELAAAAKKIDAGATPNAIVVGSGDSMDGVCDAMTASFGEVWKVANAAFGYPDAEMVRKALVNLLPADSIVLMAHEHFGMDLAPGLSIKLDSAFASDVVGFDGMDGSTLKLVRQEYGGMVSAHVTAEIADGAVITVRPGAFAADECGRSVPGEWSVRPCGRGGDAVGGEHPAARPARGTAIILNHLEFGLVEAAAILNDPAVRKTLAGRGQPVPDDTWFVAAEHDTPSDRVEILDPHLVPTTHRPRLDRLVDFHFSELYGRIS